MPIKTITRWRIERDGYSQSGNTDVFTEKGVIYIERGKRLAFTKAEAGELIVALRKAASHCIPDDDDDVPF